MKTRSGAINAAIMVVGLFLARVIGFLRESILAYYFGASSKTDAYVVALSIPTFIMTALGYSISSAVIPSVGRANDKSDYELSLRFTSSLVNSISLISLVFSITIFFFRTQIARLLAPGFDYETLRYTAFLVVIMLPTITLNLVQSVLNALLQYQGDFLLNSISGAVQSAIAILSIIVLARNFGITSAAIAAPIYSVLFIYIHIIRLSKSGYKHKWIIDTKNRHFTDFYKYLLPIMIGITISHLGVFVIRAIGSKLSTGTITYFNYAQKLIQMPYTIIGTSIITVFYPQLSKQLLSHGIAGYLSTLHRSLSSLYFVLSPISAVAILLASPIVRLVYERGAFTSAMTTTTSMVLAYLAVSLPFIGLADLFTKAFFILQDTITPLIITTLSTIIGVVLALILSPNLTYLGLAIGVSSLYIFSFLFSGLLFNKRLRSTDKLNNKGIESIALRDSKQFVNRLLVSLAKTTAATAAMAGSLLLSQELLEGRIPSGGLIWTAIGIVIYTSIGAVVFVLTSTILKAEELIFMTNNIKGFIVKIRNKLIRRAAG